MTNQPSDNSPDHENTMEDARECIASSDRLSERTKVDYMAQIARCPVIYNANGLSDISADPTAFCARFPKKKLPAEHFKSYAAYRAWRKKMISILKHLMGDFVRATDRQAQNDVWSAVSEEWVRIRPGKYMGIIAISLLADEARRNGLEPKDLSRDWIIRITDDINTGRRRAISNAIRLLEKARGESERLDMLLGAQPLPDPAVIRRAGITALPAHLDQQLIALVDARCSGELDEISNEFVGGRAMATVNSYRAASRKYIATALQCGVLPPDCPNIADAFEKSVFIEVMRQWIREDRRGYKISDRSKRSYVSCIMLLAAGCGKDVSFMKKALDTNPNMKNGRAEANTMPLDTRNFCSRLLRNRSSEMMFKSLHIRFREQAISMISQSSPRSFSENRIVQLGMLAAFSAIALWGVPLRIGNMQSLRHKGADPSLVLPHGARQRAHILIQAQDVKNRKPIKAHISDGPTRALEIIAWYLDEIRPRVPWADRSNYLFPGYNGELIDDASLREWLQAHSRHLGIPMNPHNFRHGLASLYLRDHPGEYSQAARLLCNTPETVRAHYAWIDEEAEMRKVQEEVTRLGGFLDEPEDE